MSVEISGFTVAGMFGRTPRSPSGAPAFELLPRSADGDPAARRAEHLDNRRDAARRVSRTYKAWSAGSRDDRQMLYSLFLDALRHEEHAALQLERDSSPLGLL